MFESAERYVFDDNLSCCGLFHAVFEHGGKDWTCSRQNNDHLATNLIVTNFELYVASALILKHVCQPLHQQLLTIIVIMEQGQIWNFFDKNLQFCWIVKCKKGPINSTQKPDSCQSQLFEINLTSVFRFFLYFSIVRYSRSQFCQLFTYLHIKRITKERRELTPASFYWKVEGRGVAFDSGHLAYPSAQSEWRPLSFFNQNK